MQLPNGIMSCCRGYGEHWDWCDVGQAEAVRRRRSTIGDDHPAAGAFDALLASYDANDRARDAADAHRLAAS